MNRTVQLPRARAAVMATVLALVTSVMVLVAPAGAHAEDPVATGSISGTVTDRDGTPIPDAKVTVHPWTGSDFGAAQSVQTGADGSYTAPDLTAGSYALEFATPAGYAFDADQYWHGKGSLVTADLIAVGDGQAVTGIDPAIGPGAQLSGTVMDAANTPLPGVTVTVHYAGGTSASATTDDAGAYAFLDLDPGTVTVYFDAPAASGLLGEWYFDAQDAALATSLTLHAGDVVPAISAKLEPPTVSGPLPVVSGVVAVGSVLHADAGDWTPGATLAYQWTADATPIDGATTDSLFLDAALLHKHIAVRVTGSKDGFVSVTRESDGTDAVAPGTLATAVPTVTGTVAVGFTLTADPGTWTAGTAFAYQWRANGVDIPGATTPTLVLTTAHKDKQISVKVTGALEGYAGTATASIPTAKVMTAGAPTVTGVVRTGSRLTAAPGAWTASTSFTYQWYADGVAIPGATLSTFVPTAAQDSAVLSVRVTGTKAGYATATTSWTSRVKVMRVSTPTIAGSLATGFVLTAKQNTWSAGTAFTYQWYANGVAISGATKPTLTLTSGLLSKQIRARVTGSQPGFTAIALYTATTARVTKSAAPTITGTYMVGATLTAHPNTWLTGTTFTYQWYADGAAISGATGSRLVLAGSRRDHQITVRVVGHKSGYAAVARLSAKTPRIALTSAPKVGGTLMVGSTLTAVTGTWTPGTAFSYRWYANGVAVSGATGPSWHLSKSYSGKKISVRVTGSLSGYQTIGRTSSTTAAVRSGKAAPATRDNCPSGYPIKGNQTTRYTTDWIYHVPGGYYYAVTDPEECFATETAAQAWGYRRSLR